MPKAPSRPCSNPGCNRLAIAHGKCKQHQLQERKRYDRERGSSAERGYDRTWQKVRGIKLNHDPLCEMCGSKGIDKAAILVHHILPISEGGARLALDNLMSLCNECHEEIHGKDRFKKR